MKLRSYLIISGVLFALVAIAHALRLIFHWPVQIGAWSIPDWPSWVAMVLAAALSIWAFRLMGK